MAETRQKRVSRELEIRMPDGSGRVATGGNDRLDPVLRRRYRCVFGLGAPSGSGVSLRSRRQTRLAFGRPGRASRRLDAAHETFDLTSGVHDSLLTRVERVTDIAEIGAQGWLRRPRDKGVTTSTGNRSFDIIGVNSGLHGKRSSIPYMTLNRIPVTAVLVGRSR